jgi:hypothetical protein
VGELAVGDRVLVVAPERAVEGEEFRAGRRPAEPARLVRRDAVGELARVLDPGLRRLTDEEPGVGSVSELCQL